MSKPMQFICDHCKKMTDTDLKTRLHPNSIQEYFFKCSHCFYQYTVAVTDKKVRKMQRQMKTLAQEKQETNTERIEALRNNIRKRTGKLKYSLINFGRADL